MCGTMALEDKQKLLPGEEKMLSEEELGTVDMALHEQIDIAAGHEIIQFLNDPKPFGMTVYTASKICLKP